MVNVFQSTKNVHRAHTSVATLAFPSNHAEMVRSGTLLSHNAHALRILSGMASNVSNAKTAKATKSTVGVSAPLVFSSLAEDALPFLSTNVHPLPMPSGTDRLVFVTLAIRLLASSVFVLAWLSTISCVIDATLSLILTGKMGSVCAKLAMFKLQGNVSSRLPIPILLQLHHAM